MCIYIYIYTHIDAYESLLQGEVRAGRSCADCKPVGSPSFPPRWFFEGAAESGTLSTRLGLRV